MANVAITDLTALGARPSTDDYFVVVDSSEALDADKTKKVQFLYLSPTFLTTPLTSTDFDGDSFSTTAKTKIDLSAVYGVPAGVKAVDTSLSIRDSGSAASAALIILSPNNTDGNGKYLRCGGVANDYWVSGGLTVPCDASGDIYYQIVASGSGTFDVVLSIWGYWY
jgi:hypothetical protein